MFLKWNDPSVRLTGRWSRNNPNAASAAANGAYFEFAFRGKTALMHFDTTLNAAPFPHLYMRIDNGGDIEVPLDRHLRISVADPENNHVVRVLLKGSVEMQPRWFQPLVGRVSLLGIDVPERGDLPEDNRRIIEIVGDSITEGVLIDTDYASQPAYTWDQHNRVYQDDVTATYGWMTAEALNLRPVMMGYGAVGLTCSGCGGVVKAADAYPYVFDGVPYEGEKPDVILINHGTNDCGTPACTFIKKYSELVDIVRGLHPEAVIVVLSPFCGAYAEDLKRFCADYTASHDKPLHFIDGGHWIPAKPIHPMRDGHSIVAEHLIPILGDIIKNA